MIFVPKLKSFDLNEETGEITIVDSNGAHNFNRGQVISIKTRPSWTYVFSKSKFQGLSHLLSNETNFPHLLIIIGLAISISWKLVHLLELESKVSFDITTLIWFLLTSIFVLFIDRILLAIQFIYLHKNNIKFNSFYHHVTIMMNGRNIDVRHKSENIENEPFISFIRTFENDLNLKESNSEFAKDFEKGIRNLYLLCSILLTIYLIVFETNALTELNALWFSRGADPIEFIILVLDYPILLGPLSLLLAVLLAVLFLFLSLLLWFPGMIAPILTGECLYWLIMEFIKPQKKSFTWGLIVVISVISSPLTVVILSELAGLFIDWVLDAIVILNIILRIIFWRKESIII
jgi:hypothetical protein